MLKINQSVNVAVLVDDFEVFCYVATVFTVFYTEIGWSAIARV